VTNCWSRQKSEQEALERSNAAQAGADGASRLAASGLGVAMGDNNVAILVLVVLLTIVAAVVTNAPAHAQTANYGDGHSQNHDWHRELKTQSGSSCCNGDEGHGDCRPA
jgi:hypothetical protein